MATHTETAVLDLLLFDVGSERFALPLGDVVHVLEAGAGATEPSPGGMAVRGHRIVRWRAQLLPCHEPVRVLRCARRAAEPYGLVLAAAGGGRADVALLVDHAEAARHVCLHTLSPVGARAGADRVVRGALRHAARWVTLLDGAALVQALRSADTPVSRVHTHLPAFVEVPS